MIEVFSSGGGTQSIAVCGLILKGQLPRPDYVIIVDTERERGTTWEYLENVVRPEFDKIGLEIHRVRRSEWGSYPAHGNDLLSHNGNTLLIPAFTDQNNGQVGKLDGYCSKTWKVEVRDRFLSKKFGITRSQFRKWICFSVEEAKRALQMMKGQEYQKGLIRFPLIHDVPMRRQQAIRFVMDVMGWPEPPRSACWMCPNMSDEEWQTLPPYEFELACVLDDSLRLVDPNAYLHSSCKPLREVVFSHGPDLFQWKQCSTGACFV